MRHLIDPMDLTTEEIQKLISTAQDIQQHPTRYDRLCRNKKLAVLFYEPSTRTRLSFEAAMLELGGSVLGFSSADSSSAAKGESVADTVRTVGSYADIIAIRHPKEGAAAVAAQFSPIPVINAGDGGHQHPTQTLTDLLTIHTCKGGFSDLSIGLCGDLKFGRTVHSLIKALLRYPRITFYLISPAELQLPGYIRELMAKHGAAFHTAERLEQVMSKLDVLYMTRVQQERFFNEEEYLRLRDSYVLDKEKMDIAKPELTVLHPLPRVNEIAAEVDSDPRAVYFQQAKCGKYIRMALILQMLEVQLHDR